MKKRILPLLLTLCMVLSVLPVSVFAVDEYVNPNALKYEIVRYEAGSTGEVTITDCPTTSAGTLDIPASIEGKPVTRIGSNAFAGCGKITSVNIPNTVKLIESGAFSKCQGLLSVTLPDSLQTIDGGAFSDCGSLLSIRLPANLKNLGANVFTNCTSLKSLDIPKGIPEIKGGICRGCTSLERVTIPDTATKIGEHAFSDCKALKSVVIPGSITGIYSWAFAECTSLESVMLSNGLETIERDAFNGCTSLKSITTPATTAYFGPGVFGHCTSLTSATLNGVFKSLKSNGLFSGCSTLETVAINAPVTSLGYYDGFGSDSTFAGCTSLKTLYLPGTLYEIDGSVFNDTSSLSDVYFGGTAYDWAGVGISDKMNQYSPKDPANNITMHFVPFKDVKAGDYYYNPMIWAIDKGITAGTSETTFGPSDTCTQAQIITFLWRAAGSGSASGGSPYTNSKVEPSKYYYNPLLWAYQQGVVTDKAINPDAPCTRADVVTYLWRLAGKPAGGSASFTDVPASADYAQAVSWAVKEGVTSGTSATTFSPANICTRAQIVTFLYAALG